MPIAVCVALAAALSMPSLGALAAGDVASPAALTMASATSEPSLFTRAFSWIFEQQRHFHRELTAGLRRLTAGGGLEAAWGLILASFVYGIFHAAGPGHGKAILTTYLLTHREQVRRGVWLAAAAATCQGITAIAIVYGLIWIAGWVPRDASAAALWSERASYVLVVLVGAMLIVRSVKSLYARYQSRTTLQSLENAPHGSERHGQGAEANHDNHSHHHHDGCCGHSHAPSAAQLQQVRGLRTALGLILSIGLRPCSGAVLVLVFASITGIAWAGIGAVAAMSAGTAIAVASLALLAVNARRWASSIAGAGQGSHGVAADIVAFLGSALVAAIGVSLVLASFAPSHPLGLA